MPAVGSDQQRGGWYDVMERELEPGQEWHRFAWHDRKAWWQQEQAILAYLILAGIARRRRSTCTQARESAAFYNAFFLDHDEGGVYFNVLASGMPYLLGTERLKGSHSMSGYHSIELCYLAAVYTNLLITKQPLDLHFKPQADAFPDGILRVSPDMLPPGSDPHRAEVWIDDQPYADFDADALTVTLPPDEECRVKVRIVSALEHVRERGADRGRHRLDHAHRQARRDGDVDARARPRAGARGNPQRVVLRAEQLESMSSAGARALLFLRQKLPFEGVDVVIVGAKPEVQEACRLVDTDEQSFVFVDDVKKLKPLK